MCNWKKWIWPGILATVLLTSLAMLMKSGTIENDLTAKAGQKLSSQHSWAAVELDGRDLTLTGIAPSEEAQASALKLADDAYDVRIAMDGSSLIPIADPYKLSAVKNNGQVVLTGNVPSDAVRADIVAAAGKASPGATIDDQMVLSRGAPAGFAAIAGFGIAQLTDLESGEANLEASALSVSGIAPTVGVYDNVNAALNGTLPGNGTLAKADVTSPIADPYTFAATKSDTGIVLDGFAPSNDVRASLVSAAETANPGKAVTDNIKLARGEPAGFADLASFGIAQLSDLSSGNAKLNASALSVTGVAPSVEVDDAVTATLNGTLPGNGTLAMADIASPIADPYTFAATKSDAGVELNGFVPSNEVRASLVSAAESANPGKPVTDNLTLARGEPAGFASLAGFGVGQLTGLVSGKASTSNLDLSVEGVAATSGDYDNANSSLAGTIPAGKVAMTNIKPPLIDPYVFSATENDNNVVLDGYIPNEATRSRLVAAAKEVTPSGNVVDNLKIGDGAPLGFASLAGFGVDQLDRFSTGFAGLNNSDLTIRGTALSPDAYDAATAAAAGSVPSGKVVETAISRSTVSPYTFSATKDAGVVVLDGYVGSSSDKDAIVAHAQEQNKGDRIIDRLVIANGAPSGVDWMVANKLAVSEVSQLSKGKGSLNNTAYTIDGLAVSNEAYNIVTAEANGSLPKGIELASETVRRPDTVPYIWEYYRPGKGVNAKLSGYMPKADLSSANQNQILAALGNKTAIADTLQIGAGAPRGFDAATAVGINTASRLLDGRATIVNNVLTVTGRADSQADAATLRKQVENSVPPGFTGKHVITAPAPPPPPKPKPKPKPKPVVVPKPVVKVDRCGELLTSEMKNNSIQFETNKSDILPASYGLLDRLSNVVKQCPTAIVEIEGHTDSKGSEGYNQRLSEARANAVRSYLADTGIVVSRLRAIGYGELKPIASNETKEGMAANRRIAFTVIKN